MSYFGRIFKTMVKMEPRRTLTHGPVSKNFFKWSTAVISMNNEIKYVKHILRQPNMMSKASWVRNPQLSNFFFRELVKVALINILLDQRTYMML